MTENYSLMKGKAHIFFTDFIGVLHTDVVFVATSFILQSWEDSINFLRIGKAGSG